MIWAVIKLGNLDLSLTTLRRIHWGWYSLVVVSYYASIVARGWRWQRLTLRSAMRGKPSESK